jgi:hypothetical protein
MGRYKFRCIIIFNAIICISCANRNDAERIVNKSIEAHGGKRFEKAHIEFDFRGRHYTSHRVDQVFTYTREFTDTTGSVRDVLTNDGLVRFINGDTAPITDERKNAFSNSVNSVIYFALLPFGLNDPAVNKEYVGITRIEGKDYHIIRVSFDQEGGGEDHEDVFLYWINQQSFTVDYFAYSYQTDGGGLRFRKAINQRTIEGLLFQDYVNYETKDETSSLDKLEELYKNGKLEKLSDIKLTNITVKLL